MAVASGKTDSISCQSAGPSTEIRAQQDQAVLTRRAVATQDPISSMSVGSLFRKMRCPPGVGQRPASWHRASAAWLPKPHQCRGNRRRCPDDRGIGALGRASLEGISKPHQGTQHHWIEIASVVKPCGARSTNVPCPVLALKNCSDNACCWPTARKDVI